LYYLTVYDRSLDLSWKEVNNTPGQSRGYFYSGTTSVNGVDYPNAVSVGVYAESNLRYVTPGSLVKFIPIVGYYFDIDGNMIAVPTTGSSAGIIPTGGRDYMWSMVYQVVGDGSNSGAGTLDDGTGPVIFASQIPTGAVSVEIIPKYIHTLSYSIETEIANLCMSQRNFGLTISEDSRTWDIILNSNLDLTSAFGLDNQGNVTDAGLDSSWFISFVWTGTNYKVRYRNLNFIFESSAETGFYVDDTSVNYDYSTNTVIKDKIDVLSVNPLPESSRQWIAGSGDPSTIVGNNNDYYIDTTKTTNNIWRKISGDWFKGNNFTGKLSTDYSWQIDGPVVETDGYINPKKVKVSFYDYNNTGAIEDPESFDTIVNPNYIEQVVNYPSLSHKTNFVYFKRASDGLRYNIVTGIMPFDTEEDFRTYKNNNPNDVSKNQLFYFYNSSINAVKYWDGTNLVYTDQYFARSGRANLNFHYVHNSGSDRRIDPSKTNIIDIYVLTTTYDNDIRSWLLGNASSEPPAPTSYSLEQNYSNYLEPIKAISDEIIFHPVKYKVLFGSKASTGLQAKFKAVRNSDKTTTDNDLKTRILTAINEFFALQNWDFGQSFYFSELSTYVMNELSPDITNFVITPKSIGSFGSLYEIAAQSNELFISGAQISDIEIIDAITASQLKATSSIVTTSGT
jgi:hypothetical protein